jgi:hypothetical protein
MQTIANSIVAIVSTSYVILATWLFWRCSRRAKLFFIAAFVAAFAAIAQNGGVIAPPKARWGTQPAKVKVQLPDGRVIQVDPAWVTRFISVNGGTIIQ